MPVFFSLEELDESDDGLGPTFGERMRDYRRELYKREYHRVLFLKCVSCSTESRQTANGSPRFLC